MKRTQRKKITKNTKATTKYSILIIIATLFMGIGYAKVNDVKLSISGTGETIIPEEVIITDVTYVENEDTGIGNSKINYAIESTLSSYIELEKDINSTIQYKISLYNNTNEDYMFIGVITDTNDEKLYSNTNIKYTIDGLTEYVTTIEPKQSLNFTITFKYTENADVTKNTLTSILNFRFKEIPHLVLNNEEKTLDDVYPNYTPQEYTFTISNYDSTKTNNVPMSYSFETTVDSPLTAKIYDESGNEVTDNISIEGNRQEEIMHTYTLKIIWDNTNPEESIAYNSSEYANKNFKCNITIKATPDNDEYLEYAIIKEFNVDINTASLNFNIDTNENIKVEKNASTSTLTINNYSSTTEYNNFDIDYELSITGNDKFTITLDDESQVNNIFTKTLSGGSTISDSMTIKFAANINDLSTTETASLNIKIKSPYVKTITLPLTLSLQPVTIMLNANGGTSSLTSITVYKGKTYSGLPTPTWHGHTFNGWYTASSGGTQVTNSTEVTTTASTQTLYAQWISHLLVDKVSLGEYVNYPVNYSNVATKSDGTLTASYTGWRVVGFEGTGDNRYVKLISAGVPMTYKHPYVTTYDVTTTSVNNLTTNFFSTPINATATNNTFNLCGFKNSSGGSITTIAQLKTLFTNDYTQIESGTPKVQSVIKEDLENLGLTIKNEADLRSSYLFGVPVATASGGYSYAGYYIGSKYNSYYMWATYYSGYIVYTYGINGVRPVVSLKPTVLTTGQTNGVWQISIE